jgi:hypothetical protein
MSAIEIINYSEKAIAIKGDTKAFKDALKNLNGKWNNYLKYDNTKFSGWIFPKTSRTEVEKVLGINNAKMTDEEWHQHWFGCPLTSDVGCQTDFPITSDVGCQTIKKKKKKIIIDDLDDDENVPVKAIADVVENFLVQKCHDIKQLKRMSQLMPAYDMNTMTVLIEN